MRRPSSLETRALLWQLLNPCDECVEWRMALPRSRLDSLRYEM